MIKNTACNYNDDYEAQQLRAASINRGKWVYQIVKAALDAGMTWDDIREAIRAAGAYKAYHKFPRTSDIKKFAEGFASETLVKVNDGAIPKLTDTEFVWEVNYCPMVDGWLQYTDDQEFLEKLCDACMEIDRGAMDSYGWTLDLPKTIAKGDGKCLICMKKNNASAD
ncbi:MAG: hypothetical protein LBQ57_04215 [Spirochaetales bacterium]|jgi:hypothetical protein|nr:hypothetical protein [Spirochaetales bacterium]